VNGPRGIESRSFGEIEPGEIVTLDGPQWWAAIRDKYFLLALVAHDESLRLGGTRARGLEPFRVDVSATVPVSRDGAYAYRFYVGPQDAPRLAQVGHGLQDVNPYGWAFLKPIIRPLAHGITALLLWARQRLELNYGWILILFGIAVRIVLFPLYQRSMRSQMRMAELQPALQEIQSRYRSDPARLQQEMMKIYRERGMTPLTPLTSGCLPMLLPFPFLIALFFVFRDTIEFRGAGFLWMQDLSRPDPYYVVPVLMGLSMFVLSWLGQRAIPQTNPQMKMIMYVMPIMMTIFFLALPAGLNVYYFAMNIASIPQQLYLNRERRKLAAKRAS
jgi:YidC/Oxa1 family membrane protein insertase